MPEPKSTAYNLLYIFRESHYFCTLNENIKFPQDFYEILRKINAYSITKEINYIIRVRYLRIFYNANYQETSFTFYEVLNNKKRERFTPRNLHI